VRHLRLRLRNQAATHLCAGLSLAFVLVGCGNKAADDSGSIDGPSFDEVLTDVLIPSCGFGSCHGSGAGQLDITADTTPADLVNVESRQLDGALLVIPGDAEQSYLIRKLVGTSDIEGGPMPLPNGGLDPDRIQMVRDWINTGAQ